MKHALSLEGLSVALLCACTFTFVLLPHTAGAAYYSQSTYSRVDSGFGISVPASAPKPSTPSTPSSNPVKSGGSAVGSGVGSSNSGSGSNSSSDSDSGSGSSGSGRNGDSQSGYAGGKVETSCNLVCLGELAIQAGATTVKNTAEYVLAAAKERLSVFGISTPTYTAFPSASTDKPSTISNPSKVADTPVAPDSSTLGLPKEVQDAIAESKRLSEQKLDTGSGQTPGQKWAAANGQSNNKAAIAAYDAAIASGKNPTQVEAGINAMGVKNYADTAARVALLGDNGGDCRGLGVSQCAREAALKGLIGDKKINEYLVEEEVAVVPTLNKTCLDGGTACFKNDGRVDVAGGDAELGEITEGIRKHMQANYEKRLKAASDDAIKIEIKKGNQYAINEWERRYPGPPGAVSRCGDPTEDCDGNTTPTNEYSFTLDEQADVDKARVKQEALDDIRILAEAQQRAEERVKNAEQKVDEADNGWLCWTSICNGAVEEAKKELAAAKDTLYQNSTDDRLLELAVDNKDERALIELRQRMYPNASQENLQTAIGLMNGTINPLTGEPVVPETNSDVNATLGATTKCDSPGAKCGVWGAPDTNTYSRTPAQVQADGVAAAEKLKKDEEDYDKQVLKDAAVRAQERADKAAAEVLAAQTPEVRLAKLATLDTALDILEDRKGRVGAIDPSFVPEPVKAKACDFGCTVGNVWNFVTSQKSDEQKLAELRQLQQDRIAYNIVTKDIQQTTGIIGERLDALRQMADAMENNPYQESKDDLPNETTLAAFTAMYDELTAEGDAGDTAYDTHTERVAYLVDKIHDTQVGLKTLNYGGVQLKKEGGRTGRTINGLVDALANGKTEGADSLYYDIEPMFLEVAGPEALQNEQDIKKRADLKAEADAKAVEVAQNIKTSKLEFEETNLVKPADKVDTNNPDDVEVTSVPTNETKVASNSSCTTLSCFAGTAGAAILKTVADTAQTLLGNGKPEKTIIAQNVQYSEMRRAASDASYQLAQKHAEALKQAHPEYTDIKVVAVPGVQGYFIPDGKVPTAGTQQKKGSYTPDQIAYAKAAGLNVETADLAPVAAITYLTTISKNPTQAITILNGAADKMNITAEELWIKIANDDWGPLTPAEEKNKTKLLSTLQSKGVSFPLDESDKLDNEKLREQIKEMEKKLATQLKGTTVATAGTPKPLNWLNQSEEEKSELLKITQTELTSIEKEINDKAFEEYNKKYPENNSVGGGTQIADGGGKGTFYNYSISPNTETIAESVYAGRVPLVDEQGNPTTAAALIARDEARLRELGGVTKKTVLEDAENFLWENYHCNGAAPSSNSDNDCNEDKAAADAAGMTVREFVIGGMKDDFVIILAEAGKDMEEETDINFLLNAGYRDNNRQNMADSDSKAADCNTYHGGNCSTDGYDDGQAADINGEEAQNWLMQNSEKYGLSHPYDWDEPHFTPADSDEKGGIGGKSEKDIDAIVADIIESNTGSPTMVADGGTTDSAKTQEIELIQRRLTFFKDIKTYADEQDTVKKIAEEKAAEAAKAPKNPIEVVVGCISNPVACVQQIFKPGTPRETPVSNSDSNNSSSNYTQNSYAPLKDPVVTPQTDITTTATQATQSTTTQYRFGGLITRTYDSNSNGNISVEDLQKNLGAIITNKLNVDYLCDGTVDGTKTFTTPYHSFAADDMSSSVLISEYFPVTVAGTHCFSFETDTTNVITEKSESNNKSNQKVFVRG